MARPRSTSLSIVELEQLLAARRSSVAKLQKQRDGLQKKLDAVDKQIAAAGGAGAAAAPAAKAAGGGPRAKNKVSLGAAIASAMEGKGPMGVGDVLEAVVAGGYRSGSANFRGIVNQTLIKDKRFQSAGRGMYAMK